MFLTYYVHYLE